MAEEAAEGRSTDRRTSTRRPLPQTEAEAGTTRTPEAAAWPRMQRERSRGTAAAAGRAVDTAAEPPIECAGGWGQGRGVGRAAGQRSGECRRRGLGKPTRRTAVASVAARGGQGTTTRKGPRGRPMSTAAGQSRGLSASSRGLSDAERATAGRRRSLGRPAHAAAETAENAAQSHGAERRHTATRRRRRRRRSEVRAWGGAR